MSDVALEEEERRLAEGKKWGRKKRNRREKREGDLRDRRKRQY